MLSFEIRGVTNWQLSILSVPAVGNATISVDGIHLFDGRPIGNCFGFEVTSVERDLILQCSPEDGGRWQNFLGHGSHVLRDVGGREVARVRHCGPFGLRRTVALDGQEFPYPRQSRIVLPGALITRESRRVFRADIHDEQHRIAYLGIAFYLWLREDTASA